MTKRAVRKTPNAQAANFAKIVSAYPTHHPQNARIHENATIPLFAPLITANQTKLVQTKHYLDVAPQQVIVST
jgi:hypothetical protein